MRVLFSTELSNAFIDLQRLDQSVDDHQQYRKSYMDCVAWLHAVNEKLSDCGDTAGDKDSIQAQLDKLQVGSSSYTTTYLAIE